MSTILRKYQKEAKDFILTKRKCALFLDPGLGKTLITLTAIAEMKAMGLLSRVLVIAPLRVCRHTWSDEIMKWDTTKHLTFTKCLGSPTERLKALSTPSDIVLMNRENLVWFVGANKFKFDGLIIDESSSFKSHATKRFKAIKSILHNFHVRVLLTGSPAPNSLIDLWSQIYIIDEGKRLENRIGKFRSRYCHCINFQFNSWVVTKHGSTLIKNKVSDICKVMKVSDHLELPDKVILREYGDFTAKDKKLYEGLKKDFILSLQDGDILAKNDGVRINKLLQFCNGNVYNDNGEIKTIHKIKLDLLKSVIEDNQSERFLVAYNYTSDKSKILKTIKGSVALSKSGDEIIKWNEGKIKVLVAHPASTAHGLNLQYGGSFIIWYGLNWSLELYEQFNYRLYRSGQTHAVRIMHLLMRDTIEDDVSKALKRKMKTQLSLLDYLKSKYINN